jgi:hypothetical protein
MMLMTTVITIVGFSSRKEGKKAKKLPGKIPPVEVTRM